MDIWMILGSILLSIGIAFEIYHYRGCMNSSVFHNETERVARDTYRVLRQLELPYWLMFGNILFTLRSQERIPASDTDSDVGIVELSLSKRQKLITELKKLDYTVRYDQKRHLLQVFVFESCWGPHSDIWEYRIETKADEKMLVNADYTIRGAEFPYSSVFPLKWTSFLNENVSYPNDAHYLAKLEYGSNYMTPLTTRLECVENVVNGFCFFDDASSQVIVLIQLILASGVFLYLQKYILSKRAPSGAYLPVRRSKD